MHGDCLLLGLWLIAALSGVSQAGPFTQKTSQGQAPETQVQQGLVLPKGWLEMGIRADTKASGHYRDAAGARKSRAADWRYSRLWLDVQQGFSKRITLYGSMPWVMAELVPVGGTVTRTVAMGDAHVGMVVEPWVWDQAGIGAQVDMKAPSGVEWPGDVSGGPAQVSSFLTGTGITNIGTFLHGRLTAAQRLRMQLSAGYVAKLPGVVGYVVQTDGFANGWMNPGDEIRLSMDLTGQIIRQVALGAQAQYSRRGQYRIGVSGPGTTSLKLAALPQGPGTFVDGRLHVSYQPSDHWEIQAHGSLDLMGSDTRTFAHLGLEEFSPQPGLEMGLGVRSRW